MTSPARPTLWPQVVVEEGPPLAGITPGMAVAVAPDTAFLCASVPWVPDRARLVFAPAADAGAAGARDALLVRASTAHARFEASDVVDRGDGARWAPLPGDALTVGPWRLRLVLDGPALATPRRMGIVMGVHAHALGVTTTGRAYSEWIIPDDDPTAAFVLEETADGVTHWRRVARRVGVTLAELRARAASAGGGAAFDGGPGGATEGALDADVAAGIVSQMHAGEPRVWIGFDGVVRPEEAWRGAATEPSPLEVFALLTRDDAFVRRLRAGDVDGHAAIALACAAATPASPAELGGVVRALAPDAWAREQALREECAVFVA